MASTTGLYLLAYDIADDARLRRVAAIAEKYGVRVQYSVFVVKAGSAERDALLRELERAIHPRQDDIRLYPLPAEPSWELHGAGMWPEGIWVSGTWPQQGEEEGRNNG